MQVFDFDVVFGGVAVLFDLRLGDAADDLGGPAVGYAVIGDDRVLGHEGTGTDDDVLSDLCVVHDDGAHADHGVIADGAAVQDAAVRDGNNRR